MEGLKFSKFEDCNGDEIRLTAKQKKERMQKAVDGARRGKKRGCERNEKVSSAMKRKGSSRKYTGGMCRWVDGVGTAW